MFRFPKFDFSQFDLPPRGGPDRDASGADRLAERMARFQRAQTEAFAKWAQT
jgi:hypothetical protein